MSAWYWLLWLAFTAINGTVFFIGRRSLREARELLDLLTDNKRGGS